MIGDRAVEAPELELKVDEVDVARDIGPEVKFSYRVDTATVVTDGEGKTRYQLEDGREFKSPSAAASAVMGGIATNGWRFWSLQGDTPQPDAKAAPVKARKPRKPKAAAEARQRMVPDVGTAAHAAVQKRQDRF